MIRRSRVLARRFWCWLHDHRQTVKTTIVVPGKSATIVSCRCGRNTTGRVRNGRFPMRRLA